MFAKGHILCLSWLRSLIQWVWAHSVKSILTRLHLLLCIEVWNHFKSLFQRCQKEQISPFLGLFYSSYLQVSWEQAAEIGSFLSPGPQACSLQLGEQEATYVGQSWRHHGDDCDAGYQKDELRASKCFDLRDPAMNVKAKVKQEANCMKCQRFGEWKKTYWYSHWKLILTLWSSLSCVSETAESGTSWPWSQSHAVTKDRTSVERLMEEKNEIYT